MSLQNSMKHPVREKLMFLSAFLQSPRIIGSIIPSSKHLALRMISSIPQQEMVAVAELGSGTGAITRYIAQVDAKQVLLFEQNPRMRQRLEQAYPAFQCHHNALQLREVLDQSGISQLDCIWSGLPFFNFAKSVRTGLLEQIQLSLKPGGWFIAFQYSLQMKKELQEAFELVKIEFVPLNCPPAYVYICRKRRAMD